MLDNEAVDILDAIHLFGLGFASSLQANAENANKMTANF